MPRSLPLRSTRRTLPLAAGLAAAVLLTGCSVGTTGGAGADGDLGTRVATDPDPGRLVYRTPTRVESAPPAIGRPGVEGAEPGEPLITPRPFSTEDPVPPQQTDDNPGVLDAE